DTWEWDGAAWSARATSGPSARPFAAMTYDGFRQRVVLFGGGGVTVQGDFWEWDGTAWTPRPSTGGLARSRAQLMYDGARSSLIMIGGFPAQSSTSYTDTWELLPGASA